jgi:hypothetical protein
MRLSLRVNGSARSVASLRGPGFLSAHINLSDRPKDGEHLNTVRIQGSQTAETETTSMKWPSVELQVGDVVELRILADGDGDSPSEIRNLSESPSNLFSSAELARELLEVVSDFEKQLAGVLEKSEKTETAEEHRKFKLATGAVLYEVGQQLLFPVFRRHKNLIPEELKGELL